MGTEHSDSSALAVVTPVASGALAMFVPALESANAYAAEARSENTRKAYGSDWAAFEAWTGAQGAKALPASPALVASYLAALADAGRKPSTIGRALVAISQAHKLAGHPSPRAGAMVGETMRGIRNSKGCAPVQKAPVVVDVLKAMVATLPGSLLGLRDRALLVLGFAGGFRRSELVGLTVADLTFSDDGIAVRLTRSKTDQAGEGRMVPIPFGSAKGTCPVRTVRAWLDAAGIVEGRVFRAVDKHGHVAAELSGKAVGLVVKRRATAAGLEASRFGGHSLRAGLVTSAAKAGKSEATIAKTTGHRSVAILRSYVRNARLFDDAAAEGIGL